MLVKLIERVKMTKGQRAGDGPLPPFQTESELSAFAKIAKIAWVVCNVCSDYSNVNSDSITN